MNIIFHQCLQAYCQTLRLPIQLYNLQNDIGEKENVYQDHPEVVKRLTKLLTKYVKNGRSTPGTPQKNDGGNWWLQLKWMEKAYIQSL